jgi:tetratricopeptide (TPR) repeat protein
LAGASRFRENDGVVAEEWTADQAPRPRAFISYAHESREHEEAVRHLWVLLRTLGIDARLDAPAAERRQDWTAWMLREVREADFVLVVASPEYRRRADGEAEPDQGRGVQFEAALIREAVYANREAALNRFLPVLLPGASADDIPFFLGPTTSTSYSVTEFSLAGAERLVRVLTNQPWERDTPLGPLVNLAPRGADTDAPLLALPGLNHEVVLEVAVADGRVRCRTLLAGTPLGDRAAPLPFGLDDVWPALRLPPDEADRRLADAGHRLCAALLDEATAARLAELADRSPWGTSIELVIDADETAMGLPYELVRMADGRLLATLPGVRIRRRSRRAPGGTCPPAAGPLKVLVAVAAPEESRTVNPPLDVEAEMQAILDAVVGVEGSGRAQVTFLEVASLQQIAEALGGDDRYHVLHLSAHGSARAVELEDEDGNPVEVAAAELLRRLRAGGRAVPLIVLSSCAGAAAGSDALAAALVAGGADRVLAMQAAITDRYATALARELYERLADREAPLPVAAALAAARSGLEEQRLARRRAGPDAAPPEYAVATLICAGDDPPLLDSSAVAAELRHPTIVPSGATVRDLRVGDLIGRRRELRTALKALRGGPAAREEWGALSGVVVLGIGGIGKTALAGRTVTRLREEGWLAVVQEGVWSPQALVAGTLEALAESPYAPLREQLADPAVDDRDKLALILQLLQRTPLLLVFDDFEQNLHPDGTFRDPGLAELFDTLCEVAGRGVGRVLVTSRYRPPQTDAFLLAVRLPPLTPAELRRLVLRLPSLRGLDGADRRLLTDTIGGHPRLMEFVDALLRGGRGNLTEVTAKLRRLAADHGVAMRRDRTLAEVLPDAVVLGSRDILLTELTATLDDEDRELLLQAAVSVLPLGVEDLAVARWGESATPEQRACARSGAERLVDLTLMSVAADEHLVVVHPWVAAALAELQGDRLAARHERALTMRVAKIAQGRGDFADVLEICRHYAAVEDYEELALFALDVVEHRFGDRHELGVAAFLGEVVPLVPSETAGYLQLVDREQAALLRTGRPTAALERGRSLLRAAEARFARAAGDIDAAVDLTTALGRVGELLRALGEFDDAREVLERALQIRESLLADDPDDQELQVAVAAGSTGLGRLFEAAYEFDLAEPHYERSLEISERLLERNPDDRALQRRASLSYSDLGDLARATHRTEAARRFYEQALAIDKRIAEQHPDDMQALRDLSITYSTMAALLSDVGDLEEAEALQRQTLSIREHTAAIDPGNADAKRDLSIVYGNLGRLLMKRDEREQADDFFRRALTIREGLAETDPGNAQARRDLSISYADVGDVCAAAGDPEQALHFYSRALPLRQGLAEAAPGNRRALNDLGDVLVRLARLHEHLGAEDVAGRYYEQADAIRRAIAAPAD